MDLAIISIGICGALLSPALGVAAKAASRRLEQRREGRAAALVVLGSLRDALMKTHAPHLHPVQPVVVPFDSYARVWEAERKALAHTMTPEKFDAVEDAFTALSALQKSEELGGDLREEVFDGLYDAGQLCEKARRVAWKHAQSPRAQAGRWIKLQSRRLRERREHRRLGKAVAKSRRASTSFRTRLI